MECGDLPYFTDNYEVCGFVGIGSEVCLDGILFGCWSCILGEYLSRLF